MKNTFKADSVYFDFRCKEQIDNSDIPEDDDPKNSFHFVGKKAEITDNEKIKSQLATAKTIIDNLQNDINENILSYETALDIAKIFKYDVNLKTPRGNFCLQERTFEKNIKRAKILSYVCRLSKNLKLSEESTRHISDYKLFCKKILVTYIAVKNAYKNGKDINYVNSQYNIGLSNALWNEIVRLIDNKDQTCEIFK